MIDVDRVPQWLPTVLVGGSCVATLALLVATLLGAVPLQWALLVFFGVSSVGTYGMELGNRMMDKREPVTRD